MSEQTLKVKTIYLRNDTAATWVEKNPVLAKGQVELIMLMSR